MTSLKQLWTLRSLAGMTDEDFRNLCQSYSNKESTKDLTPLQMDKVKYKILEMYPELKTKQKQSPFKPRSGTTKKDGIFVMPSFQQKELAKKLVATLHKLSPSEINLESQSLRMYKKSFQKLSRFELQGVIESLKGMIKRYQLASSSSSDPSNS